MVNRKTPNADLAALADADDVEYLRELRRLTSRLITPDRASREFVPLARFALLLTEKIAEIESAEEGNDE